MTGIAPHEARITAWLATQQDAMLALLGEAVNTDSGSYDKAGVDAVGQRFIDFMAEQGLLTTRESHAEFGDAIHTRLDDTRGNEKPILLMGHRDTVFPKGEPTRRPFNIEDGTRLRPRRRRHEGRARDEHVRPRRLQELRRRARPARGPVHRRRGDRLAPRRPGDRGRRARRARACSTPSPAGPTGGVVTGRKGGVFSVFDIEGKAAHSGGNFEEGISAIGELAHKIVAIHALTDLNRGITLNVGLVSGGQSVNTVAPWAQGQIDLRYVEPADRDESDGARSQAIIATRLRPRHEGHSSTIRGEFLPLTQTPAASELFDVLSRGRREAGFASAANSPAAAPTAASPRRSAPDHLRRRPRRRQGAQPGGIPRGRQLVPRAQAMARAILRLPVAL